MRYCLPKAFEIKVIKCGKVEVRNISIDEIIALVCRHYGIMTIEHFFNKKHRNRNAEPRQVAMYLIRVFIPKKTTSQIGEMFGRDRSIVSYSSAKVVDLLQVDKEFRNRYDAIYSELKEAERIAA